jgi:hypothetical protein
MPSLSSLEYILSRRQGPTIHYLYELHKEPKDVNNRKEAGLNGKIL